MSLADVERLMNWERGFKRTSLNTGETYATRAERIRADAKFKLPHSKARRYKGARRAKPL